MNGLLQLKGRFDKRGNEGIGPAGLPAHKKVTSEHIEKLISQLFKVKQYWSDKEDIGGLIVSVHYIRVVAKSNRLKALLSDVGKKPVDSIRGAKFVTGTDSVGKTIHKHVFTHYVQVSAIDKAINNLQIVKSIVDMDYNGCITAEDIEKLGKEKIYSHAEEIAKTTFVNAIIDCHFVEKFDVDEAKETITEESIITIYKTDIETRELLSRFGIDISESKIIGGTTVLLTPPQAKQLYVKAPYLIAMSVTDFSKISLEDDLFEDVEFNEDDCIIQPPTNEPTVGVIDTQFNKNVYFHNWVDYIPMLPSDILEPEDFKHGTAVSSIIVDGPRGNRGLDDGCGHFRVRHFGVSKQSGFSSFAILREIRKIVENNQDIKVWNLSLGSKNEIRENYISPEAAELDRIQSEYDVVFVISGTNTPDGKKHSDMKVGAPADSLNSLVVNSVDMLGKSASYTRRGPVLSFFHKPDICYYGGDGTKAEEKIAVCTDELGAIYLTGTSFAAPWITRKLAYLIYVMGLSREVAKALIIDSAAKWGPSGNVSDTMGYGVVPKHIEDILNTSDDEIKFIITGTTEDYETYNYTLPVPVVSGKHPYYAKAVLCYFPHCDRNQGVDYTGTEMDIHFGRVVTEKKNGTVKTKIKSIDDNRQTEEGQVMYEEDARNIFRKWDNVKRICEKVKERRVPKKSYDAGMWGIGVITKERVTSKNRSPLQFGLVITLKEMYGKNRIDDFVKMCEAKGWLVNRLDVQNQLDIYARAEEEITFN